MAARQKNPGENSEEKTWTSIESIDLAVKKLTRRKTEIQDLIPLNLRYNDDKVASVETKLNETLIEVFGVNSRIVKARHSLSYPKGYYGQDEIYLQKDFTTGLSSHVSNIQTQIDLLEEKREDLQDSAMTTSKSKAQPNTHKSSPPCIFIGHGHSYVWKDLKEFLQEKLGLKTVEFNSVSAAGKATTARLQEMLEQADFAFVVMTGEDESPSGKLQARLNVVHEVGLFQGRLGFEKAIVLLEDGCEEFSNIEGHGQIRFPKNTVTAKSEEIRDVLKREGII